MQTTKVKDNIFFQGYTLSTNGEEDRHNWIPSRPQLLDLFLDLYNHSISFDHLPVTFLGKNIIINNITIKYYSLFMLRRHRK